MPNGATEPRSLFLEDFEVVEVDGGAVAGHAELGFGGVVDAGGLEFGDELAIDEGFHDVALDGDAELIPLAFFEVEFGVGLGGSEDFFVFGSEGVCLFTVPNFEVHRAGFVVADLEGFGRDGDTADVCGMDGFFLLVVEDEVETRSSAEAEFDVHGEVIKGDFLAEDTAVTGVGLIAEEDAINDGPGVGGFAGGVVFERGGGVEGVLEVRCFGLFFRLGRRNEGGVEAGGVVTAGFSAEGGDGLLQENAFSSVGS